MLIAQISDCHVVARGSLLEGRVDTGSRLRDAVARILSRTPRPDVVVATGDLVNDARRVEYDQFCAIVDALRAADVELLVTPGNHDDRAELRRRFGHIVAGAADDPVDVVVDHHEVRLIGFDTTVPGEHGGAVSAERAEWLDATLARRRDAPTLVFQHHPPFHTGIAWMDAVGLAHADRQAEVLRRHRQVIGVIAGHIHRPIATVVGGVAASCAPSTGAQVELSLDGERFVYVDDVAQYALHDWQPAHGLRSHLVQVHDASRWVPSWGLAELSVADPTR